jgi:hypothetical protein
MPSEIGVVVHIKETVSCDAMTYKLVRCFREENEVMLALLYFLFPICAKQPLQEPLVPSGLLTTPPQPF